MLHKSAIKSTQVQRLNYNISCKDNKFYISIYLDTYENIKNFKSTNKFWLKIIFKLWMSRANPKAIKL